MESTCRSCGEGPVVPDPGSGVLVCTSCGLQHDGGAHEFVHQATFNESGEIDTAASRTIRISSQSPYLDHKLEAASAVIKSTAALFSLSPNLVDEVLHMAQSATDGSLATPDTAFLPALAAACVFLVARSRRLPISLAEAAAAAPSCTTFALADLASRIASRLSLPPLPSFDYSSALQRAVQCSSKLREATAEDLDKIISQARFLLRCASKWSLTTGRHPLPLVAAVIAFAAELNGVTCVSVEEIAREISAVPYTSRRRYKELVAALVHVARKLLPWGADVNARNLLLNAPMLLRLMEMRSSQSSDHSEQQFLESFAPDIAGIGQAYSSVDDDESKYLQSIVVPLGVVDDLDFNNSGQQGKKGSEDSSNISQGCMLSDTYYHNVLKRIAQLKELGKVATRRKRWKRGLELEPWMDSKGNDWSDNMPLEKVADIDIGYDAPPPSFTAGMELQRRRRARIEAAKRRIDEIRKAPAACIFANAINSSSALVENVDVYPQQKTIRRKQGRKRRDGRDDYIMRREAEISNAPGSGKKRGACNGVDWEDCIVELLLLHGANEAEIEQGQYKRLLELHVFSGDSAGAASSVFSTPSRPSRFFYVVLHVFLCDYKYECPACPYPVENPGTYNVCCAALDDLVWLQIGALSSGATA